MLTDMSAAQRAQSHLVEARASLEEAAGLYQEIGDRIGEASAQCGLCHIAHDLGAFDSAEARGLRAISMARESGDRSILAYSHHSLGYAYVVMARYESALDHLRTSLRLHREEACPPAEALVLAELCNALRGLGRHGESLECGEQALAIAGEIRYLNGEYEARQALGEALHACGRTTEAIEQLTNALDLAVRLEQPQDQARAQRALGAAVHDVESRPEPA
jgi:tetratricopeptide (TPR) repeat protein